MVLFFSVVATLLVAGMPVAVAISCGLVPGGIAGLIDGLPVPTCLASAS